MRFQQILFGLGPSLYFPFFLFYELNIGRNLSCVNGFPEASTIPASRIVPVQVYMQRRRILNSQWLACKHQVRSSNPTCAQDFNQSDSCIQVRVELLRRQFISLIERSGHRLRLRLRRGHRLRLIAPRANLHPVCKYHQVALQILCRALCCQGHGSHFRLHSDKQSDSEPVTAFDNLRYQTIVVDSI